MDGTSASSSPHRSPVPATAAPRPARTLGVWPVDKPQGKELRNKLLPRPGAWHWGDQGSAPRCPCSG